MVLLNMPKTIRFQAITHWAHMLETKLYLTQQNKKKTQTRNKNQLRTYSFSSEGTSRANLRDVNL